MCLFLEIWVKKWCILRGQYFPITVNIFSLPKIWNYLFRLLVKVAFVDKIIRGNIYFILSACG